MAILINTTLTIGSGIQIPAGAMVKPAVHFPEDRVWRDNENNLQYQRKITYDILIYQSKSEFQDLAKPIYGVNLIPYDWEKVMTNQEYLDLMANGLLAETWLKDQLNTWLGGNYCTIIDPYSV